MMDADKACKIVDGWEPPQRFEVKGQPFIEVEAQSRQVARTLRQALAEAQETAQTQNGVVLAGTRRIVALEAERDAARLAPSGAQTEIALRDAEIKRLKEQVAALHETCRSDIRTMGALHKTIDDLRIVVDMLQR